MGRKPIDTTNNNLIDTSTVDPLIQKSFFSTFFNNPIFYQKSHFITVKQGKMKLFEEKRKDENTRNFKGKSVYKIS